jgi:hypothetical protein
MARAGELVSQMGQAKVGLGHTRERERERERAKVSF